MTQPGIGHQPIPGFLFRSIFIRRDFAEPIKTLAIPTDEILIMINLSYLPMRGNEQA